MWPSGWGANREPQHSQFGLADDFCWRSFPPFLSPRFQLFIYYWSLKGRDKNGRKTLSLEQLSSPHSAYFYALFKTPKAKLSFKQTDLLSALVQRQSSRPGQSSSTGRSGTGTDTHWCPAGRLRQWRWWRQGDSGRGLSDGGPVPGSCCRWC